MFSGRSVKSGHEDAFLLESVIDEKTEAVCDAGKGSENMKILNTPLKVGSLELKTRLVMPPMATEKTADGLVNGDILRYYDEKTRSGGLGLVVTEHVYVSPEGKASPRQISAAGDDAVEGFKKLAGVIHRNGVPVILQINHAGSMTQADPETEKISCSAVINPRFAARGIRILPRAMDIEDIERVRDCYVKAAVRAKAAGMDGVEVHSAHGYLLNQFYSPLTNLREDEYTGATVEGRTRLQCGIIKAIREVCGKGFLISVRLGAADHMPGGSEAGDVPEAAERFQKAGADMISITGGLCGFILKDREQGWFSELSEAAKAGTELPVLLTGGITDAYHAEKMLEEKKADLIGIGRALLTDSELPAKMIKE